MAETDQDVHTESLSIGERLRQAREKKGLSLDDIASQTRIPLRHLNSIENNAWDELPAVTYSVGFVRSYANAIGMDGSGLGAELRDQLGSARPAVNTPEYYEPADPARVPPLFVAMIAAVIAVIIIAGYLIWRSGIGGGDDAAAVPPPSAQAVPASSQPAATPSTPPITPETAAGQPVALVATDEVWLRIDAAGTGSALFQGILRPGERYLVPADARQPSLRTGRPQVLRIVIGDRDLGPLAPEERTVSGVSLAAADLAARLSAPRQPALPQAGAGDSAPSPAG